MNSYILLRDNKESSSLSLEDLQQIGLKTTDLIWVECQSVGWRNPHEITELKPLLTGIKPLPVVHTQELPVEVVEQFTPMEEVTPVIEEEKPTPQEPVKKKLVFVELPASPPPVQKKEATAVNGSDSADFHKYAGLAGSAIPQPEKTATDINTKYSRPLDEIKEMYVKNMEQQGKQKKPGIIISLPKEFKKVAVYAGLFIAGAVIMLLITNKGSKRKVTAIQNAQQPAPVSDTLVMGAEQSVPVSAQEGQESVIIPPANYPATPEESPVKKMMTDKNPEVEYEREQVSKPVMEKAREEEPAAVTVKPAATENISSMLSLQANDYIVGSFGGIRNLEMTLQNDSKYLLDKVIVELKFLNIEGSILKTEQIHFESVYPGEAETIPVAKSKRGVKIAYRIKKIESKGISGSTTGL